jgi:hypothetical protein
MKLRRLHRRTLLRGLGGVAVALPALEIMLDDSGTAYADGTGMCQRYFVGFGGFSLRGDNGPIAFRPSTVGPGYDLHPATMPLGDYGDLRSEISIVSNMRIPNAQVDGGAVQPGGAAGFHWHSNPLVTGNRQVGGVMSATVTGPSSDQLVAAQLGEQSAFRSLNYRTQAQFYVLSDTPDYRDTIAFEDDGTPVAPTVSPRLAYETLFTGFDPSEEGKLALRKRVSVLDLVERRTGGVLASLGAADRRRMDEHYTHIRELERRLEQADPPAGLGECVALPHPGDDPPLGGSFNQPTCSGGQYDPNAGYSGEYDRGRLLSDFIHMAFVCDLNRVAAHMYSMFQCFMNAAPLGGATNHDVHASHHMSAASNIPPIAAWHLDQFAYLVAKLRDTQEGAGTVLDNCAMVFMIEGGAGVGPSGSESHSTDEMSWLLAGGAGGLRRGEHIMLPAGYHPVQLLISAMHAVGVNIDAVGEVSGPIPEVFA